MYISDSQPKQVSWLLRMTTAIVPIVATQKSQSGSTGLSKGYKSYQPATPCGNKLLQKKWDQTYFDEHRRLVKSAKPVVDTRTPATRPHITSKWKKQQVRLS